MPELTTSFQSLPKEYQQVIRLAQDTFKITVAPLQLLVGGWSGAVVYLVSVSSSVTGRLEHCILKLDRKGKSAKSDEVTRHNIVTNKSTPEFARAHIAELVFDRIEHEGAIGIFYRIAGQSLLKYRPLSNYERQSQLKTIFTQTNTVLLSAWNSNATFEQAVHPQEILGKWLGFRLDSGGNIERFLQETCQVNPATAGFLINGHVFPNPLLYARRLEPWGKARSLDVATGFIHGDLNTNNILVKFSDDNESLAGYYLIDFALFKENMPLLYDQRYLEMSYLIHAMSEASFAKCVNLLTRMSEVDILDSYKAPIEMSGVSAVIASARNVFAAWAEENHPSLDDDLWGQYWLAGVAAGLTYCHKTGLAEEQRLAGLIYAAINLKRYAAAFSLPLPTNVELLYDANLPSTDQSLKASNQIAHKQTLPSGTVTFLFSDIEGSTKLSQQYSESMPALLARHHEILDQAVTAHHGFTFQIVADSYTVAFHNASDALAAALDIQRALHKESWSPAPIKVRMGIHTGPAQLQDASKSPRYSGYTTISMSQRVMSSGHGGQILLSQIVANLVSDQLPSEVKLRDMGERRLKDILQPVHLYQLTVPDLPSDFPPLTTEEIVNHNLPTQLTPFIGREAELASLKALLADDRNRLITIMAPGGMGKTRLALETARQVVHAFPQGIYFVALDRITSADLIVQSVADVLPIILASSEDPKSRVLDYLRDKTILLVMDNFEHVLDGATFVQDILQAAPRVQILTSSRLKLNLTAETIFNIEGLTIGERDLEKNSALQLFDQSARRIRPDFELNNSTLPVVTEICRLVGGMPLAIVLAAAWIDTLSLDEIAAEVEVSLDMLATETRDTPDRQRSVRAVIESSWNQVDATSQNLLKRLSVFRGGFTRAAAQEAAGASLRGLSQLVDKSLLRRDPDRGRYSIHELLRQYAEEQLGLSIDEERSAYEDHAKYFADFMKTREEHLHDHRGKTALWEIEADFDNIRIAWTYWTDNQDASRLLAFTEALWIFFEVRSSYTPAIQLFDGAAQKLVSSEPQIVCARAKIRARQAWFTALIGLPEEGLRMAQESVSILRQHNQDINIQTLQGICINAIFLNKIEIVAPTSQEIVARAERSGDTFERAWALVWQAYTFILQNQIDKALQTAGEVHAMSERLDNPLISWWLEALLGYCSLAIGDTSGVKTYFSRAAQKAEAINWLRMLQISYEILGRLAIMEKDVEHAQQFSLKCLRISQECGQTREMLASLRDLASVQIIQGNLEQALQLLAVVLNDPVSEQNSLNRPERLRDEAEKLRSQIEAQLEQSRYQVVWESGQRQRLADVVTQILN
ncbi:MAG TPA: adenylate/guanylate cyclase domain-containing protein [Anaerolineales bacterium]|nr:adenylate/guanylate cyclase domain-containing protein [Anaerolineales bacterium]